jgi:GntP family gluconate:H+ symporter
MCHGANARGGTGAGRAGTGWRMGAPLAAWTGHDTTLVLCALAGVALIIGLITSPLRLHPFLALLVGSLFVGLATGLDPPKIVDSLETGAGGVLGNVGIVLALGTMLGKLLAESGGADQIAATVLGRSGPRRIPWAMALIAMIVGIPLFFEIGVVLLIPIIFTMARQVHADRPEMELGRVYLLVGLPALAGLSVLHGLVPPHPGPLIAIDALHADLGRTLLYGLVIAIPTVAIAGPLFARVAVRWATADPPRDLIEQVARETTSDDPPGFGVTLLTVLLPVGIMLLRTVADVALDAHDPVRTWADFVGDPKLALLIAVLVACWTFGYARGFNGRRVSDFLGASLAPAAAILLIIGAGGAFKQLLIDTGIGDAIAKAAESASVSALVLGWGVAVLIRLATGSATVATVTAAGIMAPIVGQDPAVNAELLALAVGAGSLFLSHVNDAGFWLINQYFGMSVPDTFKTWSAMETIISVVGIALILVADVVV